MAFRIAMTIPPVTAAYRTAHPKANTRAPRSNSLASSVRTVRRFLSAPLKLAVSGDHMERWPCHIGSGAQSPCRTRAPGVEQRELGVHHGEFAAEFTRSISGEPSPESA